MKETFEFLYYEDKEILKISFATLIIRVESLNEKYGSLSRLAESCQLWGVTNGKIFVLSEMMMPPPSIDQIIEEILLPIGMTYKEDFAFTYEYLIDNREVSRERLNKPIPAIENISWLGSKVNKTGNFVWYKKE